jgi:signal transduction histidine kinase
MTRIKTGVMLGLITVFLIPSIVYPFYLGYSLRAPLIAVKPSNINIEIKNLRYFKHQVVPIISSMRNYSSDICREEVQELIDIYNVFTKILSLLQEGRVNRHLSVKEEYNGQQVTIYETIDILVGKASAVSKKAGDLVEEAGISDRSVYILYMRGFLVCELIEKYIKRDVPLLKSISIYPLLMEFKTTVELHRNDIEITGDKDISIMGTVVEFFEIFEELASNAISHGGAQKFYISVTRRDDNVEIIFEDNGKGISKETFDRADNGIQKLFVKGYTTRIKEGGTGLALIYDIITNRWNGNIVADNGNRGGKFTITLPVLDRRDSEEIVPCINEAIKTGV